MELTPEIFDSFTRRDDWLGFGYLGSRRNELAMGRAALVAEADEIVLNRLRERGLTQEELFEWSNSKRGRWFGDCYFGSHTHHHATDYLPQ